ncbi:hypothetical protein BDW22DRAFT_1355720 [Trametopsis cervina]|nr:hypothetical protein BDW22DRAFT_1355720 [Trametopsis cervina]
MTYDDPQNDLPRPLRFQEGGRAPVSLCSDTAVACSGEKNNADFLRCSVRPMLTRFHQPTTRWVSAFGQRRRRMGPITLQPLTGNTTKSHEREKARRVLDEIRPMGQGSCRTRRRSKIGTLHRQAGDDELRRA